MLRIIALNICLCPCPGSGLTPLLSRASSLSPGASWISNLWRPQLDTRRPGKNDDPFHLSLIQFWQDPRNLHLNEPHMNILCWLPSSCSLGSYSRSGVQGAMALAILGTNVPSCPPAADAAGFDGDTAAPVKKKAIKKCFPTADKKADPEATANASMWQVTTKKSRPNLMVCTMFRLTSSCSVCLPLF